MGSKVPKLETVRDVAERAAIVRALLETGSRTEAAEVLGIGRSSLYRKMDRYDLNRANFGLGGPTLPEGMDGLFALALKHESEA